jgi:hypothetical protein
MGGDDDPPHDPETPPDSTDPAGICPRCGRTSNFTQRGDSIALLYHGGYVHSSLLQKM